MRRIGVMGVMLAVWVAAAAWGADVGVSTVDLSQRVLVNRKVTLTPEWSQASVDSAVANADAVSLLTDTNGSCVFSNVITGWYKLAIAGNPGTSYRLPVPTNSGYFTAAALIGGSNNMVVASPPFVSEVGSADGSVVVTRSGSAVDLAVVGGGGATNAPWPAAGTDLTASTNSLVVTLSAGSNLVRRVELGLTNAALQAEIYSSSNSAYAAAVAAGGAAPGSFTNAGTLSSNQFTQLIAGPERGHVLRTPILGVDSWFYGVQPGQKSSTTNLTRQIDGLVTNNLVARGWRWVQVPDGWQGGRTNGVLYPNPTYIPNITNLCSYANSNGVGLIVYTEPKAGTAAGGTGTAPEYIEQDVAAFISWGLKGIRVDFQSYTMPERLYYLRRFRAAIDKYSTPHNPIILYSSGWLSYFDANTNTTAMAEAAGVADVIDVTLDLGMAGPTVFTDGVARFQRMLSARYLPRAGHWLVPQGTGNAVDATWSCFWGLYALLSSGSMIGNMPDTAPGLAMLKNTDLELIRNDPLLYPAFQIRSNATEQVVLRPMSNGDVALGLINLDTNATTTISVNFTNIGRAGTTFSVRDVVNQTTWSNATGTLNVPVAKNTAVTVRLSPVPSVIQAESFTLGTNTITEWPTTGSAGLDTNGSYVFSGSNTFTGPFVLNKLSFGNAGYWTNDDGVLYFSGTLLAGSASFSSLTSVGGVTAAALSIADNPPNDGSFLTNLNAARLASGTVPLARLPYAPQPSSANLTNWSQLSTNVLSDMGGGSGITAATGTNISRHVAGVATWYNVLDYGAVPDDGNDDTAAIQAAINAACGTNQQTIGATVFFPDGLYHISGTPDTTNNAQIIIPRKFWASNTMSNWSTLRLQGAIEPPSMTGSSVSGRYPAVGARLLSNIGTNGGHVITSAGVTNTAAGDWNALTLIVDRLTFEVGGNFGGTVLQLSNTINASVLNCSFHQTNAGATMSYPQSNSIAIDMPKAALASKMIIDGVDIGGFWRGIRLAEHNHIKNLQINGCVRGIVLKAGNLANVFERALVQGCNFPVYVEGANQFEFLSLQIERLSADWRTNIYDVVDSNNGRGVIRWRIYDNQDINKTHNLKLDPNTCAFIRFEESQYDPWEKLSISQASPLHLRGPQFKYLDNSARSAGVTVMKSRGTTYTPTAASAGDFMYYGFGAHNGSVWTNSSYIAGVMEANAGASGAPIGLSFVTGTNQTAARSRMYIRSDGDITVSNNLSVAGSIVGSIGGSNIVSVVPPAVLATNSPSDGLILKATSATSAMWDTAGGTAANAVTNASWVTINPTGDNETPGLTIAFPVTDGTVSITDGGLNVGGAISGGAITASGIITGDASGATNIHGTTGIQSGTIDSNSIAPATLAAIWGGGGGSQTPWTSDINGGGYQLTNVGGIQATAIVHKIEAGAANTLVVTNGRVGILKNNPTSALDVNGFITGSYVDAVNYHRVSAGGFFAHSAKTRWYSQADGNMHFTKNDGTSITFAVTNGTAFIPNGITVKGMSAEPTAVPGSAQIYAATNTTVTDLYVQSDDGQETLITGHADDAPAFLYDSEINGMKEKIVRERNDFVTNGMVSFINMRRLAKITELNTRAILYLAGNNNNSMSNALVKLKDLSPAQRQIIVNETYAQYNARTGANLKPKVWEEVQAEKQAAYDAERALIAQQREWLTATNALLSAKGDTNLVELPIVPEAKSIIAPKPSWMSIQAAEPK